MKIKDDIFDIEFQKVLNGRNSIGDTIQSFLNSVKTDFPFEIIESIDYEEIDEDEEDESVQKEYPVYGIYLNLLNVDYKYSLLNISLPTDSNEEFPILVEFNKSNKKESFYLISIEDLKTFLKNIFESKEFQKIINRLKSMDQK